MLEQLTWQLASDLDRLPFSFDGVIYNPLDYARANHSEYLSRCVRHGARTMFLGMNPGPFGMVQTGVPFGAVPMVRDYLHICNPVDHPAIEHPARQILGFDCPRTEVSGLRFWGLVQSRFPDCMDFFKDFCVMNYCPLAFLDKGRTARNITPDKLAASEQRALSDLCDEYLRKAILEIGCTVLIGIGQFARRKLESVAPEGCIVSSIIHPSPASPAANRGWAEAASASLAELGVWD
ncbi:MAG: single-stranded DNA-binding protein [Sphaerochaetaceae bacterium]|nr:single-stranded DNA-binding protein [Sphaerochaetaceae bacterium]